MSMTKEQRFDELLVAKIIAAAESSGAMVESGHMSFGVYSNDGQFKPDGPVCAIGAGVLYRSVNIKKYPMVSDAFAAIHRVNRTYACGVSDGFEGAYGSVDGNHYVDNANHARGYAVGEAVRAAFEDVS